MTPSTKGPLTSPTTTSSSTERETRQVDQANASGRTPVVFIHGLWLLPSSWDRWAELFEEAGYAAVTPSWPDDPETVAEARAHPEVFAGKTLGQVADHTAEVIGGTSARSGAKLWTTRRPQEVRCACR
jgi:non-heme chloroperoxidase